MTERSDELARRAKLLSLEALRALMWAPWQVGLTQAEHAPIAQEYHRRKISRFQFFKVDPQTATHQSTSDFFGLPAEIRNTILELACSDTTLTWTRRSGKKVEMKWTTTPWKLKRYEEARGYRKENLESGMTEKFTTWKKDGKPAAPGLMLACKQMYEEANAVFFFNARFVFDTKVTYLDWLGRAEDGKLQLHRHVFLGARRRSYARMREEKKRLGLRV